MSVIGSNVLAGVSGQAAGEHQIDRSLRFNDGDSPYLSKTFGSGTRKKWTWNTWLKRASTNRFEIVFGASGAPNAWIAFGGTTAGSAGDHLAVRLTDGSTNNYIYTDAVFRDTAWYHIVISIDTDNGTEANRIKFYINGILQTRNGTVTSGLNPTLNSNIAHSIGRNANSGDHFDGYLAETLFLDGQTPGTSTDDVNGSVTGTPSAEYLTDFGEFDAGTGVWNPKAYSGTYGTNGFYLKYADDSSNAAFGTDSSGNNNTFTVTNLSNGAIGLPAGYTASGFTGNLSSIETDNTSYIEADSSHIDFDLGASYAVGTVTFKFKSYNDTSSANYRIELYSDSGYSNLLANSATSNASSTILTITHNFGSTSARYLRLSYQGGGRTARVYYLSTTGATDVGRTADTDSLIDSPMNYEAASGNNGGNYATLNPLSRSSTYLTNGNLELYAAGWGHLDAYSTIGLTSSKWYWEVTFTGDANAEPFMGISSVPPEGDAIGQVSGSYGRAKGTKTYIGGTTNNSGGNISISTGDTIGFALDLQNGTLQVYVNGTAESSQLASSLDLTKTWFPAGSIYGPDCQLKFNFGQRPFAISSVPTGHLSVCTQNLPDPTIENGSTAMDVALYTGNDSARNITGFNMSPDLVWLKARSNAQFGNHALFDAVRGATEALVPNDTQGENTESTQLTAFNSDGFSLGGSATVNDDPETYCAWAWDAGANSNKTYTVKVVDDNGNKYRFDGHGTNAVTLDLEEGSTYVFDQSDSSNATHPLRFSSTSDGTHNSGSEYTTGVTATGTPGSAGAKTTIVVASGAPTLYYYCSSHSGMGGQVNTNSTAGATVLSGSIRAASTVSSGNSYSAGWAGVNYNLWANSDSWSGLSAVSNNGKGYFSGTENLSNGSVIYAPNSPFNAPANGAAGFVLRSSATVTLRILVYSHIVEIATTDSDSQTFANRTIVATNPTSGSYVEATGKCFWWTTNNQVPSISAMGTFYDAPAVPSITSTVRANTTAGFSIVKGNFSYVGDGTLAHGLNAAPTFYVIRNIDSSSNWYVYTTAIDGTLDYAFLNTANSFQASSRSSPTSSVIQYQSIATGDHIAYCWTPVEGHSAFGKYSGNGSDDGGFVYTGFRPKFILTKAYSSNSNNNNNWNIYDTSRSPYNEASEVLSSSNANQALNNSHTGIDILSNGFKLKGDSSGQSNYNGWDYLYAAFAEHPQKIARAR